MRRTLRFVQIEMIYAHKTCNWLLDRLSVVIEKNFTGKGQVSLCFSSFLFRIRTNVSIDRDAACELNFHVKINTNKSKTETMRLLQTQHHFKITII